MRGTAPSETTKTHQLQFIQQARIAKGKAAYRSTRCRPHHSPHPTRRGRRDGGHGRGNGSARNGGEVEPGDFEGALAELAGFHEVGLGGGRGVDGSSGSRAAAGVYSVFEGH